MAPRACFCEVDRDTAPRRLWCAPCRLEADAADERTVAGARTALLYIRCSPELRRRIEERAVKAGRSAVDYARMVLAEHVIGDVDGDS